MLETNMADLGIARLSSEAGMNGTLTRADLADVVHRNLGLSRAESANIVEYSSLKKVAFCIR